MHSESCVPMACPLQLFMKFSEQWLLPNPVMHDASSAWWGFSTARDIHLITAFNRRSIRQNYCTTDLADINAVTRIFFGGVTLSLSAICAKIEAP